MSLSWIDRFRYGKQSGYEILFKRQDTRLHGKPGVILAEIGMPEDYDFTFYDRYMRHVMHYAVPFFIRPLVLMDRGIALIDPENPLARERFKPRNLVDAHGASTNRHGVPYSSCKITWVKPRMRSNPWDHGYFLYQEDGKGGAPEICQKTGAKVKAWYHDRLLPEKKAPWAHQHRLIYQETEARLKQRFPCLQVTHATYALEESFQVAVETLLNHGCQSIIYQCFSNPVYSDFEEYNTSVPRLSSLIAGRARLIIADQIGNQPHLAQGFARRLADMLSDIPNYASVCVILSCHGHPFKKETMDRRAHLYRQPVETAVRTVLAAHQGRTELTWSQDEYANDPSKQSDGTPSKRIKPATSSVYRMAIERNFDFVIELPTEFFAESTDTLIFHAMKKFHVFDDYDRNQPITYTDWETPLVRCFHRGNTTAIYAGCLVGPYRTHVVDAVTTSVESILTKGG